MSYLLDTECRLAEQPLSQDELFVFEEDRSGGAAVRDESLIQTCPRKTKLMRKLTRTRRRLPDETTLQVRTRKLEQILVHTKE